MRVSSHHSVPWREVLMFEGVLSSVSLERGFSLFKKSNFVTCKMSLKFFPDNNPQGEYNIGLPHNSLTYLEIQ